LALDNLPGPLPGADPDAIVERSHPQRIVLPSAADDYSVRPAV